MSNTTNEKDGGLFGTGLGSQYVADDHAGHKGYANTAEDAQAALEQAQAHDVSSSEHHAITGLITDSDKK